MSTAVAILTALAGVLSALPFLIRTWQAHRVRLQRLREIRDIKNAVYSGDRDRLADLLERLRTQARHLR